MSDFKIGDVVRPVCDGPRMTVAAIRCLNPPEHGAPDDIKCQWFIGDRLHEHWYGCEELVRVEDRRTS